MAKSRKAEAGMDRATVEADPAMAARGNVRAVGAPNAAPTTVDRVGIPKGVGSSHPGSSVVDQSDPREFAPTDPAGRPMTPAHNAGDPRSIAEQDAVAEVQEREAAEEVRGSGGSRRGTTEKAGR